jgi:hypothetical protein
VNVKVLKKVQELVFSKVKVNLILTVPCIVIQFTKMTNKMELCRIIYCSLIILHVSSDIFAHYQEHLNCIYSFWYYSRVSLTADVDSEPRHQPATTHVNNTRSCKYS